MITGKQRLDFLQKTESLVNKGPGGYHLAYYGPDGERGEPIQHVYGGSYRDVIDRAISLSSFVFRPGMKNAIGGEVKQISKAELLADYRASVKVARKDLAVARRKAAEAVQEIVTASYTLVTMIRDCEALEKQLEVK